MMELKDLSNEGKITCISLFNLIVAADHEGTTEEAEHVAHLADAFGKEEYQQLLEKANEHGESEEEIKAVVAEIKNQEERNLIYGNVMDCAFEDGLQQNESEFLDWLAKEWAIEVKIMAE